MYQHAAAPAAAAGTLPFTGGNPLWFFLAGVAVLAVGGAIRRLTPRREA